MTEVQRSFDPSILERQVTAAADLQAFQVTGSNQPQAGSHREASVQRHLLLKSTPPTHGLGHISFSRRERFRALHVGPRDDCRIGLTL